MCFNVVIKILHNSAHVLQPLIPDRPPSTYGLRPRTHDKLLLDKTTYLNDREFVIRILHREFLIDYCTYASELCLFSFFTLCYLFFTFCYIKLHILAFLENKMTEWMNEWLLITFGCNILHQQNSFTVVHISLFLLFYYITIYSWQKLSWNVCSDTVIKTLCWYASKSNAYNFHKHTAVLSIHRS